ncbi:MAG: hypothetical protein Q9220_001107 [cf. Caloplaca sp. 1 TL-2023]
MASTIALASSSHALRTLLLDIYPGYTFRHLDLSTLAISRVRRQDRIHDCSDARTKWPSHLPELNPRDHALDEIVSPLRQILYTFDGNSWLQYVTTLILDGMKVSANLLREILCDEAFNVRILSLRKIKSPIVKQLRALLLHIVRPSRPADTPKLKGLYYFSRPISIPTSSTLSVEDEKASFRQEGVTTIAGSHLGQTMASRSSSIGSPKWMDMFGASSGLESQISEAWARVIDACEGIIAFDAVVCRHAFQFQNSPPRVVNIAFDAEGCQSCHVLPEGLLALG